MTPEQILRLQVMREAESLKQHLTEAQARLVHERITERRGRATVTLDGLGAVQGVTIAGVDHETQDCLLAALLAAQGRAQAAYDALVPSSL